MTKKKTASIYQSSCHKCGTEIRKPLGEYECNDCIRLADFENSQGEMETFSLPEIIKTLRAQISHEIRSAVQAHEGNGWAHRPEEY